MTEPVEDEFLHYILMDKRKKMIGGRRMYEWYGKKFPHVSAPLEYHGEPWDFAFAEPGGFIRLFKEQDGDFYGIETNSRDPRIAGSVAAQKKGLVLSWLQVGRKDEEIRMFSEPPFGIQSFEECKTVGELLSKLASGHWPRGKGLYIDDICFINREAGGDGEWKLLKGNSVLSDRFPVRVGFRELGNDKLQEFIEAIRSSNVQDGRNLGHDR